MLIVTFQADINPNKYNFDAIHSEFTIRFVLLGVKSSSPCNKGFNLK